ncbi:caffeic acid 3-O-methyltransferase 1-like [Neltuma alba]|uniref:caffeic acid 3-O-methyltransferase 1-like n=1 Tax=Neltuma alba TaxID=207710 RepID=UPI0010A3ADCF|nr:caffeic acid 3-O-methyltransferase 1-like [Prosopis alba]
MAADLTLKSNGSSKLNDDESDEENSFSYAMQVAMSSVLPMALQTTIELGVFGVMAKAGAGAKLSANDIAHQLPMVCTNPDAPKMLDRLLGLLATHSLLRCSEEEEEEEGIGLGTRGHRVRLYSLAPASKFFVADDDHAMSLGPLLAMVQHKTYLESWFHLKDAIVDGGTAFERGHGGRTKFEYIGLNSELNQIFNTASVHHTCLVMKKVLECYKGFEQLNSLVDVGGGLGLTLSLVTSKYPHLMAINFDLPHVINHAPPYPGVQHVAGDMFEAIPKGDAIFMKWILHDWNDKKCLKLLKNCHQSIPEDGKVIAMESLISDMPETSASAKCNFQIDVFMMAQGAAHGRLRSHQGFLNLAKAAGFKDVQFKCFVRNFWVMEFFK